MAALREYAEGIESLAQKLGLDYYPVDFELAPASLMTEIAVYGLPVRMPHWSFGVRYIHQLVRQSMGHSKIFEVRFPGDPCRAFLMDTNSTAENALVTAHVLGHADFSKNNQLFAKFHSMAGSNIVETAAAHAHRIQLAIDIVTEDTDLPSRLVHERSHDADERRLPGPIRSEEREKIALVDIEVHPSEGLHTVLVGFRQAPDGKRLHSTV